MSLFYVIGLSFDNVFNTSRNYVSRSSVEDMQVCPRFKLKKCYSLKLDS